MSVLRELDPLHIWSAELAGTRLAPAPARPIHVLLLRVHNLRRAVDLAQDTALWGCFSWGAPRAEPPHRADATNCELSAFNPVAPLSTCPAGLTSVVRTPARVRAVELPRAWAADQDELAVEPALGEAAWCRAQRVFAAVKEAHLSKS